MDQRAFNADLTVRSSKVVGIGCGFKGRYRLEVQPKLRPNPKRTPATGAGYIVTGKAER